MTGTVRPPVVKECTAADRDALSRAFVTSHAVNRFRRNVRDAHPNEATQDIIAGLRDHAVRVRSRASTVPDTPDRMDVDIEPPSGRWWVARIVDDQERGKLVVETVLEHRANWDTWPAPDGDGLWLSVMTLDRGQQWVRNAVGDIATMHRRVLDLVEEHPRIEGRRPLWAQPKPGVLLVRSTAPVTAAPPRFTTKVEHQPWTPPDKPGRWWMTAAVNPVKSSKSEGSNRRSGKGRGRSMTLHRADSDVAAWLSRKLTGAELVDMRQMGARITRGRHHDRPSIKERVLTVACVVDVHDPDELTAAVTPGVGRGKAWGCGLTLWEPAR